MEHVAKLGSWGELYVMLGTSSAALIGLLFVATSLHLSELVDKEVLRTRSRNLTLHLVAMLVQATAILTPQPLRFLGIEVIIVNLCGMYLPLTFISRASRESALPANAVVFRFIWERSTSSVMGSALLAGQRSVNRWHGASI